MRRSLLAWAVLAMVGPAVFAQNYRFSVPEAEVTVRIEGDGAALIHYALTFRCSPGAHPIDIVDVGMPNIGKHSPGEAAANGQPLPGGSVRISEVLKPRGSGYEIHLGPHTIQPGQTGRVEFIARESGMVWQDTTSPDLASFRFTPTWFGSEYIQGTTQLTLRCVLPIPEQEYPAVKDRILWQKKNQDFDVKGVMEGETQVSVAWVDTVLLNGPHEYGLSFPKRFVTNVRKDSILALFLRWFSASQEAQYVSGALLVLIFSVAFFALTRGTGFTLWIIGLVAGIYGMVQSVELHLWLYLGVLIFAALVWLFRLRRKRGYFAAELCREGGGLKRGLTAVEAAILLEIPLNKVLTMIVFALAKKGLVTVKTEDPLTLDVARDAGRSGMWTGADGQAVKIRPYEQAFLKAFRNQKDKPVEAMNLEQPFDALIKRVRKAMEGFDLKSTREYYRSIVSRAWATVEAEAGYEARYERIDKHFDWLMLDDGWGRRLDDTTVHCGPYRPRWWTSHSHGTPSLGGGGIPAPTSTNPSASFGDVASAIAGRFEGLSTRLAGSLDALAPAKAGLDLSGIDRFTGDVLKALAESRGSGGGGGHGGGCACACAGCACACACAGGGR
ncbi:MAG: hypothetical protein IT365_21880 [Candidatus Hydrogenedentes bacterium]|nr:hypothetical protein [Candidatus Hydrogenedentota bacterium]